MKPRILIIEDSNTLALSYEAYLQPLTTDITIANSGADGLTAIHRMDPALVILDLKLPDMDGVEILRMVTKDHPFTQVIVITAHGSVSVAVEAMREGAADFLLKPFNAERLITTVQNVLEMRRLASIVRTYRPQKEDGFGGFIGTSPAMQSVYEMIRDAAGSKASVFLTGESGSGKEICAETLHLCSPRSDMPFVALNCAAIPASLIESEIFGHKKGAFTGATEDRIGAAQRADGGTLLLDEICEMPLELQAKMLRFIQTGEIIPVGGTKPISVNVRFMCATNRAPEKEISEGRFREDLYYRLHVIPIHLPPLRERGDDVLMLAKSFLAKFSTEEDKQFDGLSSDAEAWLRSYRWPGNVRELSNMVQSAVVLEDGPLLTAAMLKARAERLSAQQSAQPVVAARPAPAGNAGIEPLEAVERRYIERALDITGGNVTQAAVALGVHPTTLYRKMKGWDEAARA